MLTVNENRSATQAVVLAGGGGESHGLTNVPRSQDLSGAGGQSSVTGVLRQRGGQLTQLRLEQPLVRHKRADLSAETGRNVAVYPTVEAAKKADASLQSNLTHYLLTGRLKIYPFPPDASIRPFMDAFVDAAREPRVQAWLQSKGLDLATMRVFSDGVEGPVLIDGKHVTRRFTTTDGSGWWEVGANLSEAAKMLRPDNGGVLLPGDYAVPFRDLDAVLHFYGVEMSSPSENKKQIGERLKEHGWPAIANEKRTDWRQQFEQLTQNHSDVADRSQLASNLQALVKGKSEGDTLPLSSQPALVSPGSTLAQKSLLPRERLVEWLLLPAFKAFIEKIGLAAADNVYRIADGNLELRDSANQWISLQVFLDDEISKVSAGGSPAEKAAVNTLNHDFNQLVEMSGVTGNVLYSQPLYDMRQMLAFSGLGSPETVAQVNSAIGWLTIKLPPSPMAGDYAGLSPYNWRPGGLSAGDFTALKVAAAAAGSVTQLLTNYMAGEGLPNDPDLQLQRFFDSPQAVVKAQALAQQLNMVEVRDGAPLPKAIRHQLLAAAIKASVSDEVPGKPGVVAGYEIYQPGNLGRAMRDVRDDIQTQLKTKGADVRTAPLIAHLMLAQAAPEFLLKPDPNLSVDAPESLKLSPGLVSIGSTAWMNLRQGCEIAEKLGGAGSSRALNIAEAQALTRLNPMGPDHEVLFKCLGVSPLLDWAVMSGVFPKRSDGLYSPGDYSAAAQAFADRESVTLAAFQSLTREPPTQMSLLIDQLVVLFPEMTREEIAAFKLELDTDKPFNPRNEAHLETRTPLLTELILTEQAKLDPFLAFQKWLNDTVSGVKKYTFTHPRVSQETFNERIKQLPIIEPLVAPAVKQYLADQRKAQETVIKLMISNAPLDVRQGLENGDVEIFTLREETGDPLAQDDGESSNVAEKRARQGVLLRYKDEGSNGWFTYLEMFPGSMKVSKRFMLFSTLKLDGVVEKGFVPYGPFAYVEMDFRKATLVDFDLDAYKTGSAPRTGVRTNAIVEKFGRTLPGQTESRRSVGTARSVPNSWASRKTNDIAKAIVDATFKEESGPLMEYANQPTALNTRRSYPFDSGKIFTKENLKMVLSLIPFVGGLADIADGNIGAGVKGLLIDFASFIVTGGVSGTRRFFSGFKALVPFSGRAFRMVAAKEAAPFFRSLFNPLDGFSDVLRIGPKAMGAAQRVMKGELVSVGRGFFLTTTAFEKCRWGIGAYNALSPLPESRAYPGSQMGASQNQPLSAVKLGVDWYAIDPITQKPTGTPLEHFTPDTPAG
ncbi:hypothetical protein EJ576_09215 [Pseudomonas sp. C 49-2]|uniref:hypothetical protein n=1 Tax=Pseudomonas TaxID=286 RepID=UPI000F82FA3B|nr:hypothetical protein [Pseudomonas sp. C 49-2]RTY00492.1 hypothetical protein EJ576_09215 [Pseudomonas sp. C 49-2]